MNNLLLSTYTKKSFESFINNPGHGLLIVGKSGMGKLTLAESLASKILNLEKSKLLQYQYFRKIIPITGSITINDVREIKKFLSLRTTGNSIYRRIVIIQNAELMTTESQNSILKQLEEPPEDTIIILTASDVSKINKTLLSRITLMYYQKPNLIDTINYFEDKGFDKEIIEKNYLISNGVTGTISDLLNEEKSASTVSHIDTAKNILLSKNYERLKLIDEVSKDKDSLSGVINGLKQLFHAVMLQAIKRNDVKTLKRSLASLYLILEIAEAKNRNVNTKLLVTKLMVNL